jgi:hypothetical protein
MSRQEQFVKIYTKLLDDEWFVGLTGIQRGIFLQLIVMMKRRSDCGYFCTRSVQELSTQCAVNRRTMDRMIVKMQAKWPQCVRRLSEGVIEITLPNYSKYQAVTAKKNNIATNNRDQTKTRPDQTRKESKSHCASAKQLDPYEELRREDLTKVVEIIGKWDCMKNEKNPYGIAGKLVAIYKHDPVFACEVLRQKSDIFCLCKNASHLIASATATYQRASDIREIESAAHKHDDGTKRGGVKSIKDVIERNE